MTTGETTFRRSEERDAGRQFQREAARARAEADRAHEQAQEQARAAWLASPVGAATTAREAGESFFEIQLEVGGTTAAQASESPTAAEPVTGETSTARLLSGEATAVSGVTIGVYLFRRTAEPGATEPAG